MYWTIPPSTRKASVAARDLLSTVDTACRMCVRESWGIARKVSELGEEAVAQSLGIGVPTLQDIVTELLRPDVIRATNCRRPLLRTDVLSMEDLKPGMELMGTVRNVIDFGAFVDVGVHKMGWYISHRSVTAISSIRVRY